MTLEHLTIYYQGHFDRTHPNVVPKQLHDRQRQELSRGITYDDEIGHLKFMCVEIRHMLERGQRDNAKLWLGFLQGVFWARGGFTLDQLIKTTSEVES